MRRFIDTFKRIWNDLDRSIYVGDRLRSNMLALTFVSFVTAALGLILIVINLFDHDTLRFVAAVLTFAAGLGCAFCTQILKNREAAIKIPTIFCAIACPYRIRRRLCNPVVTSYTYWY